MALDRAAARRAWASFAGLEVTTRAFLLARMAVAPLGALEAEWRALRGRVLSLGCGYGVVDRYVAELNPAVTIDGVERDRHRVCEAFRTQARAPRVRVHEGDVRTFVPPSGYDAALAVDLLHHVPFRDHAQIAASVHRALRPGGVVLVKEMAPEPRPQYLVNRLHDRVVSGPEPIACRSPDDMAALLQDAGFVVDDVRRVRRADPYPQYLVHARRPA